MKADQCMYEFKTRGDTSESSMPSMKPTRFMSNSPHKPKHLGRRCDKSHRHQPLEGGRCADAAFYPLPLIRAILRACMTRRRRISMYARRTPRA